MIRLPLGPLSSDAVRSLAGPSRADAVLAVTGGNPFLVHEVLASPNGDPPGAVPPSVVDLVLARMHRIDPDSRDAVERLSVITSTVDRPLVDALVPGGLAALASAEEHGLLLVEPRRVGFRHELTRRAVVDALPAARRTTLNAAALAVLAQRPDHDPAQLVAPRAGGRGRRGRRTARSGGGRRRGDRPGAPPGSGPPARGARAPRRASTSRSWPTCWRPPPGPATPSGTGSAARWPTRTRRSGSGAASATRSRSAPPLRSLSRIAWWVGDRHRAEEAAAEAVAVLSGTEDRRELALALSNVSQLAMLAERMTEARENAERAIELAREVDDRAVLSHALNNLGTAQWAQGDPAGRDLVERSRTVALEAGLSEHASRAWCNVVWQLLVHLRPDEAGEELAAGIEHAEADEQVAFWKYLTVERGLVALAGARWSAAVGGRGGRPGRHQPDPVHGAVRAGPGRAAHRGARRRAGRGVLAAGPRARRAPAHRPRRGPGLRGRLAAP